jgi:hypothetical protein
LSLLGAEMQAQQETSRLHVLEPCNLHELHLQLDKIICECQRLTKESNKHARSTKICEDALTTLWKSNRDIGCPEFLLMVEQTLREAPSKFCEIYPIWVLLYGVVLGKLLSHETQGPTQIHVHMQAVWSQLAERFKDGLSDQWQSSLDVLNCFLNLTDKCISQVAHPEGEHFGPFWTTIDLMRGCLKAALDSEGPVPAYIYSATLRFVDLWFQLLNQLVQSAKTLSAGALEINIETQIRMMKLAKEIGYFIKRAGLPPSVGFEKWCEGLCAFADHLHGDRNPEVQRILGEIADTHKNDREKPNVYKIALFDFLRIQENLMPRLHGRIPRASRKQPRKADCMCDAAIIRSNNSEIKAKVELRDICAESYGGFCIEFSPAPDLAEIRAIRLENLSYHVDEHEYSLPAIECDTIRIWTLENHIARGMAILAPQHARQNLPTSWRRYVDGLPTTWR